VTFQLRKIILEEPNKRLLLPTQAAFILFIFSQYTHSKIISDVRCKRKAETKTDHDLLKKTAQTLKTQSRKMV